ncbi:hypothetical protein DPMN_086204 [Dreissena polymorpha]|uniref:Uncharacterized protein n=3 Tax=Dreissena polymorpha TaxID=45954 RepID=A0A9D3YIE0_DREPO|nr:hypothetical protein DPMN_086204 [Dreissena polymorpha]
MNTTLTEIKDEKHVHYSTDDKLLKPDDNRPSSLFSKASLLGNHAMNRNLHHDLSPLELIATVANDISCLQEGRGLKRKPEVAQLYENDEDASSTETQIKRTVERAIDLCSSNNSKSLKDKKTIVDASASVLPNDPQNRKSSLLKVPGNINEKSSTNEAHNMSKSLPQFKDNKSNSMSATSGKSGLSVQLCDKPIKMDTASQCEHKAKKLKTDLHSKTENIKKSENLTLCSKNSSKPIEPPQNRLKPGESGKNSAKHNTICKPEKIPENDSSKNVLNGSKNKDDTSKLAIKSERAITSKGISKTAADKQLPALPNKTYSGRKSEKQQTGLPSNAIGNRASSSPARTHPSSTAAVSSPARTHPSSTAAVSSPARTHPSSTAAVSSPARTHPSSTAAVSKRQSVAPNHPDPKPSSSKTHVPNQQDKASCNIDQKPNPTETLASNKIDEASRDSDSKPVQKKVGGLRPLFKKSSNAASPMKADKAVAEGKASPQKSSASGNIFELTGNASKLALPVAKNGDTCHTRPESVGDVGDGMKENNNKTDDKGVVDKEETCPVSEKISHPHDKVNEATTKAAPQINGHSTIKDIGSKHHTTAQPTSK